MLNHADDNTGQLGSFILKGFQDRSNPLIFYVSLKALYFNAVLHFYPFFLLLNLLAKSILFIRW